MQPVRIMTFNIRGYRPYDGRNFWPERAELNLEVIKRYQPDVIGFQECQRGNLETYKTALSEYQWIKGLPAGISPDEDHLTLDNPIFWSPARFELLDTGGFYLSETPEIWSQDWGNVEARVVNWVKLVEKQSDKTFLVMNTHFDHESRVAHNNSAILIIQKADELSEGGKLPVIVIGDFNSNAAPTQPASELEDFSYQLFLDHGFRDSYLETGNSDGPNSYTFHDFKGRDYVPSYPGMDWRIDWIMVRAGKSPVLISSCQIIRDANPPIYPSDHYPVLTELEF